MKPLFSEAELRALFQRGEVQLLLWRRRNVREMCAHFPHIKDTQEIRVDRSPCEIL